jgi:hypothetical protein
MPAASRAVNWKTRPNRRGFSLSKRGSDWSDRNSDSGAIHAKLLRRSIANDARGLGAVLGVYRPSIYKNETFRPPLSRQFLPRRAGLSLAQKKRPQRGGEPRQSSSVMRSAAASAPDYSNGHPSALVPSILSTWARILQRNAHAKAQTNGGSTHSADQGTRCAVWTVAG